MTRDVSADADVPGGFPLYILDDDTLVIVVADMNHCEFWETTVAALVAGERAVPLFAILNLPYCQRRARIVGDKLYCGEHLSPALLKSIETATGRKLRLVYDEHETRCPISVAEFKSLVQQTTHREGEA